MELMGRGILTWPRLEREPPWGGGRNRREFGQGGERPSFMTCTWGFIRGTFFFFFLFRPRARRELVDGCGRTGGPGCARFSGACARGAGSRGPP